MNSNFLRKSPTINLIIGACVISFSGVWVKIAEVTPASSAFYRVFFGLIFLLIFSALAKEKILPNRNHFLLGTLCGALFACDLLCWHNSIKFIGPGLATLLGNFQVFVLACVGIVIFKERHTKLLLLAVPLALIGLYLIVGVDWPTMTEDYKIGMGLGLATALFYSAYILSLKTLTQQSQTKYQPMVLVSFFTAAILAMYISAQDESFVIPDATSFISLASLGFFSQCLGWVLIATALPKVRTSSAGLILLLQPSLAFIWDVLFFARPTSLSNWLGVILTLTAIYLGLNAKR